MISGSGQFFYGISIRELYSFPGFLFGFSPKPPNHGFSLATKHSHGKLVGKICHASPPAVGTVTKFGEVVWGKVLEDKVTLGTFLATLGLMSGLAALPNSEGKEVYPPWN